MTRARIFFQPHHRDGQELMPNDTKGPPLEIAIAAKSRADQQRLADALAQLVAADPSLVVATDPESGQTVLKGMSELHLDNHIDHLLRTHKLALNIGAPEVAFLERITRRVEFAYTHKKQTGGVGEFAGVSIVAEPNAPGKGNEFRSLIVSNAIPDEYIPGVEKGVRRALATGVVAGFPVVDTKVTLTDGKYHDVDSSALAFEIAARSALREALAIGGSELLEPIMKVEVRSPTNATDAVVDDLKLRRGRVERKDPHGEIVVIDAIVPLMNMFGYANNLRWISKGRATFTMRFDDYEPVPGPDDDPPFRPAIGMWP
jgi:elongation factor G